MEFNVVFTNDPYCCDIITDTFDKRLNGIYYQNNVEDRKMNSKQDTAIIKLAAEAYLDEGYSPVELLLETAIWLWTNYKRTGNIHSRDAAKRVICAYVELGLPQEQIDQTCDQIWKLIESGKSSEIPRAYMKGQKLQVKRTQIRTVLGVWPRSQKGELTADGVVRDIMERIERMEVGKSVYKVDRVRIAFELNILDSGEVYLTDLVRKRIYSFIVTKEGEK